MVSEEVKSRLLQKREPYETSETLGCKSWLKLKKQVFNVNYEYKITAVEGEMITLNNAMTLTNRLIKKHFVHNYCRNCHSFQGSSNNEAITVFDPKLAYVTRKRRYTVITKATDLKQLYYLRLRREQ